MATEVFAVLPETPRRAGASTVAHSAWTDPPPPDGIEQLPHVISNGTDGFAGSPGGPAGVSAGVVAGPPPGMPASSLDPPQPARTTRATKRGADDAKRGRSAMAHASSNRCARRNTRHFTGGA